MGWASRKGGVEGRVALVSSDLPQTVEGIESAGVNGADASNKTRWRIDVVTGFKLVRGLQRARIEKDARIRNV